MSFRLLQFEFLLANRNQLMSLYVIIAIAFFVTPSQYFDGESAGVGGTVMKLLSST